MTPSYLFNIPSTEIITEFFFDKDFELCKSQLFGKGKKLIVVDENVWNAHRNLMNNELVYIVPNGESSKSWKIVEEIISFLLKHNIHKNDWIIGIGGGVVTDLVGFVAAIYKRGTEIAFFPTTILAMVDAAIGGKNGVNFGDFKNMVGTISQPNCIIYDFSFLQSLPYEEWVNGFAEILKHACILDADLFNVLQENDVTYYMQNKDSLVKLIQYNVHLKCSIVHKDMNEKLERKLLNFGHTIAHGLERLHGISHGHAVAIGMCKDAQISDLVFSTNNWNKIQKIVQQYQLPTFVKWDVDTLLMQMKQDKKASDATIDYILLKDIGHAVIHEFDMLTLKKYLD